MNKKQRLFGNKLKKIRMQKNLTQEQLASFIGITANAIGQFERGETYPNFETLHRIITTLDIDANLIFSGTSSECPYTGRQFAELLKEMSSGDSDAVNRFLNGLSDIMALAPESEYSSLAEDDEL